MSKRKDLWTRLVLTQNKKNYASTMRLQEGVLLNNELDIKGLQIRKSNVNKYTRKELQSILEETILRPKDIDFGNVIKRLFELENVIRDKFKAGDVEFCSPGNSKTASEYAEPMSQANYRAACLYNLIYPNTPIVLPDSFNTVRLRITSFTDPKLLELRNTNPEIYRYLIDYLFDVPTMYVDKGSKVYAKISNGIKEKLCDTSIEFGLAVTNAQDVFIESIDEALSSLSLDDKDSAKKLTSFNKNIRNKLDMLLKPSYNTNLLALPKSEKKIPDWVIPLIDIEEILKNNLSTFLPLFNSLGGKTVQYTASDKFITNIIL